MWLPMFAIDRLRRQEREGIRESEPLALIQSGQRGLAITALNERAQSEGLFIGQALADARAAIPGLVTRVAETDKDDAVLYGLAYAAGRYGPARNTEGGDGLWIDITGVGASFRR